MRMEIVLSALLVASVSSIGALDLSHSMAATTTVAESDIQTGNATNAAADNEFLKVNEETPVRYDQTQLWRVYNISDRLRSAHHGNIAEMLEHQFGGNVWKENSKFIDISINSDNLEAARNFLYENNISSEILNGNIQSLIDNEQYIGALAREEQHRQMPSNRTKKSTDTSSSSGIHWKDYHDLDVIYNFMRELRTKFPQICRLYNIGRTAEGRDLKVMRISENPKEYKKIWIDGGIHAREWISPAVVTYIMKTLLSNWDTLPDHLRQKTWYIMPVMNPDGYVYSRQVNRLWRKNRSPSARSSKCFGVDLNRNFDIGWSGFGSSTNPCSDTYRGSARASELETQGVVRFLTRRRQNLGSYLTFHSYGEMIVYPWAFKAAKVKDHEQLQHVANMAVNNVSKATGSTYRASVTHEILGIAGGGSDDWCRDALKAKYVYTIELRDRGYFGFVLPPDQIRATAIEGYTIVDTIARFF